MISTCKMGYVYLESEQHSMFHH